MIDIVNLFKPHKIELTARQMRIYGLTNYDFFGIVIVMRKWRRNNYKFFWRAI